MHLILDDPTFGGGGGGGGVQDGKIPTTDVGSLSARGKKGSKTAKFLLLMWSIIGGSSKIVFFDEIFCKNRKQNIDVSSYVAVNSKYEDF